jgi:hypothetical protein
VAHWLGMANGDVVESTATERLVQGVWMKRFDWPEALAKQSTAPMRMGLKPGDIQVIAVRRGTTHLEFRYELIGGVPER